MKLPLFIAFIQLPLLTTTADIVDGKSTVYGNLEINQGSCGTMKKDPLVQFTFAINGVLWKHGTACGDCYKLTVNGTSTIACVSDVCHECTEKQFDLTKDLWNFLYNNLDPGIQNLKFEKVDCPVTPSMDVCLKDGSNPNWLAIQFANIPETVTQLKVNGIEATRMDNINFFELDKVSNVNLGSIDLHLTEENGQTLAVTTGLTSGKCQEVPAQFSTQGSGSSTDPAPALPTPTPSSEEPCPPMETKKNDIASIAQQVTLKSGNGPKKTSSLIGSLVVAVVLAVVVGMTVFMKKRKNAKAAKSDVPNAPLQTVATKGAYGQSFKTPNHHSDIAIL